MQHARPPVISEPAPGCQHRSLPRASQPLHRRKPPEKLVIVRDHCRYPRLLQHDLRQPHPVGIMARAPGQRPSVRVIPRQQLRAEHLFPRCGVRTILPEIHRWTSHFTASGMSLSRNRRPEHNRRCQPIGIDQLRHGAHQIPHLTGNWKQTAREIPPPPLTPPPGQEIIALPGIRKRGPFTPISRGAP